MKPILLVVSPYYEDIAAELVRGATHAVQASGHSFERIDVPGALEIPAAIACAASTGRYAGYIGLGCVVRGETSHYDIIAEESARGLQQLAVGNMLAIGNGILTCETMEQAQERANPSHGDKGGWAAKTCLRMMEIRNQFGVV